MHSAGFNDLNGSIFLLRYEYRSSSRNISHTSRLLEKNRYNYFVGKWYNVL